jgi:prepilin-type N-terminal cleavage/methylation domain-containing protein
MNTRHRHVRATHGFTLIEVLLTMVLAAALLAGLWTLLSMHLRLFDTGQTKTEQSQLARTLLQQMSDDLHSIVQMPPPPPPAPPRSGLPLGGPGSAPPSPVSPGTAGIPGGAPATGAKGVNAPPPPAGAQSASRSTTNPAAGPPQGPLPAATANPTGPNPTSPPMPNATPPGPAGVAVTSLLRPSGLFGTENYLQIDVLQPTIVGREAELDERPSLLAKHRSRAPELRTVVYTFEEGRDPQHPFGEPRMCLARRELDWEQAHAAKRADARQAQRPAPLAGGADAGAMSEPIPPEVRSDGANDESTAVVPEVTQFGMRYFDGSQWFKEWDSAARKALPLAIEVAVQLRAFDEPEQPSHHLTNESAIEEAKAKPPQLPIYRLVIHLPSAAEPVAGDGRSQLVNFGGRGGAERPLGTDTNGARR